MTFGRLKEYILNLEYLERLFLMFQDLEYSPGNTFTRNVSMYLIKREYRKVYNSIKEKHKQKEMTHFESRSKEVITRFLRQYNLDSVELSKDRFIFTGTKADNQMYRLFLYEALEFGRRYFRIADYKMYKKINKKALKVRMGPSELQDTALCMSCMKEIKSNLLKYHLEGKRHRRSGSDRVIQIEGDLSQAEHLIGRILKYSNEEEKNDQIRKRPRVSTKCIVEDIEEFEDEDGNVYDKETYFDLKRNDLL